MTEITRDQLAHSSASPAPKPPSLEEYQAAYSVQPIEIVEGEMIPMSPTGRLHGKLMKRLLIELDAFATKHTLGEVFVEIPYLIDADDRSDWVRGSRVPDVSFIAQARIDEHEARVKNPNDPWRLAPDLAVEIVSPTDLYVNIMQKIADYLRYGVRLVWVINPTDRTVRVFTPADPNGQLLTDEDILTGDPVLPGWSMPVAAVLDNPVSTAND